MTVSELLEVTEHPEIRKIIAQKDITYSNSPIEAINKIAKRYVRTENPDSEQSVNTCIKDFITDYCEKRPHISLNGLTPMEAYTCNKPDMNYTEAFERARTLRLHENRQNNCRECEH